MRKKLPILFTLLLLVEISLYAQTFMVLDSIDNAPRKISPDGKYIVGIDNDYYANGYKSYLWNPGDATFQWKTDVDSEDPDNNNNGSFKSISNNGIIVGHFIDFKANADVAAIWKDGQRIHHGWGSLTGMDPVTSEATCISADGKTVGGYLSTNKCGIFTYIPVIWQYKEEDDSWEMTELTIPGEKSPGGWISEISADGRIWIGKVYGQDIPAIWEDGEFKQVDIEGTCLSLSGNGYYVVIKTGDISAVLYDLWDDTYREIETFEDVYAIQQMKVDNNGNVYGTVSYIEYIGNGKVDQMRSFYFIPGGRNWDGSIIAGKLVDLEFIIRQLLPGQELPDGISFCYEDKRTDVIITDISADGNVIIGEAKTDNKKFTWVFNFERKPFILLSPPRNPEARVTGITEGAEVTIEWDVVGSHAVGLNYDVDYYRVFCDGKVIYEGEEEIIQDASGRFKYVHKNVPAGYHYYSISAICKPREITPPVPGGSVPVPVTATLAEGRVETPKTNAVEVAVADDFSLPFFDNFDSDQLSTNYWITGKHPRNWWGTIIMFGIDGSCVLNASTGGDKEPTLLTSRHLDARTLDKVYLSFAKILVPSTSLDKIKDSSLEIAISLDGQNWRTIKKYSAEQELAEQNGWEHEILDISDWVAGEVFQLRLTVDGDEESYATWFMDWFSVTGPIEKDPAIQVKGYIVDDEIKLSWTNSWGNYELTHMVSQHGYFLDDSMVVPIGNEEGEELIIANGFDNYDLHAFDGMYLTSITAYLHGNINSVLELVVFEDNKEIRRQPITEFITPESENTFVLKEPVKINKLKTLKYGIRVQENSEQYMFRYQQTLKAINGKSDLFSSDNGKTWSTLRDVFTDSRKDGAWHLIAHVTEEPVAKATSRDQDLLAYYVYRDGEIINDSYYSYHLTRCSDEKSTEACYKVMAYYSDGTFSEFSNEICIADMEDISGQYVSVDTEQADHTIQIYPNPASEVVYINKPVNKVTLINLNGQVIAETDENRLSVSNLAEGIYFLNIITRGGYIETEKLVVKH